jgi:hypothetical protein
MTGRVYVLHSVEKEIGDEGWRLCFQYGRYVYEEGSSEEGYRFIWRRPNGNLQAARGQARIPSIEDARELIELAINEGWGNLTGYEPIV